METRQVLMYFAVVALTAAGCSSERYVHGSDFNQSCETDDDCRAVREGYACSCEPACPNAAINKQAVSAFEQRKQKFRRNCSPVCWESQSCGKNLQAVCNDDNTCVIEQAQEPEPMPDAGTADGTGEMDTSRQITDVDSQPEPDPDSAPDTADGTSTVSDTAANDVAEDTEESPSDTGASDTSSSDTSDTSSTDTDGTPSADTDAS